MPLPELKAWVDFTQVVLTCLAIVGAAVWALYGYRVLRQRDRASGELRNLQQDTAKKALETEQLALNVRRQAIVQVDIQARAEQLMDGSRCILAQVQLKNTGNQATGLDWARQGRAPFSMVRVDFDQTGAPVYTDSRIELPIPMTLDPNLPARAHVIRAGASEMIPFAVGVATPGLYLASFRAEVAATDRTESYQAGTSEGLPLTWVGRAFVVVS